jgi:hypothetical protein
MYIEPENPLLFLLGATTLALTLLSWYIWNGLNNRAYKFRKNAIDVIEEKSSSRASK